MSKNSVYVNYLNELIKKEEVTPEVFLKFCDKLFYGLSSSGYQTIDEAKSAYQGNIIFYQTEFEKAKLSLLNFLKISNDFEELHKLYQNYYDETSKLNEQMFRENQIEKEKFNKVKAWSEKIPQLSYVWEDFSEPTCIQMNIMDFDTWVKNYSIRLVKDIEHYERALDNVKQHLVEREKIEINFLEQKEDFLKSIM